MTSSPVPTEEPRGLSPFSSLGLDPRIVEAVAAQGFEQPTAIQARAIPPLLEGRDVVGRARTGSGKTAAFGLPLLERVKEGGGGHVRGLILAPTRELALQVSGALSQMAGRLRVEIATLYGGSAFGPQLGALRRGAPIVVGTPGRVLDHLERGTLKLDELETLILDEADEMLRMGFFEDVEKIVAAAPAERQLVLFSATMPGPIRALANRSLRDPVDVAVESEALSVSHIEQHALVVPEAHKPEALQRVLECEGIQAALVFCRTRVRCTELAQAVASRGFRVEPLSGDLNQEARERVVRRLRSGALQVVVATDVAGRGLDVDGITHVINVDMPNGPEIYVHRIGRTGRAGRAGKAIAFFTPREAGKQRFFERALRLKMKPYEVPSDAAIATARGGRLAAALEEQIVAPETRDALALVERLKETHSVEELAAAAIAIIADEHGIDLSPRQSDAAPGWARSSKRPERRPERQPERQPRERRGPAPLGDEVGLFLPVGRDRGLRPADIVGALANDTGISGKSIGRVTILPNKTFVSIQAEAAQHVLANHRELSLCGNAVPLYKARPGTMPSNDRGPSNGRGQSSPRGREGKPVRRSGEGVPPVDRKPSSDGGSTERPSFDRPAANDEGPAFDRKPSKDRGPTPRGRKGPPRKGPPRKGPPRHGPGGDAPPKRRAHRKGPPPPNKGPRRPPQEH